MFTATRRFTLTIIICVAVAGCSDDSANNATGDSGPSGDTGAITDSVSVTPATATFKQLTAYSAIKGKASLEATITGTPTKLELLADGKVVASAAASPWTITWDTSVQADGLVKLSLKAQNAAGSKTSDAVPVVVLNKGTEVTWKAGNSAVVIVPASGYVDQHLRYHWDMPIGVTKILAVLSWDKPGFKLELALGMGVCPDSGTVAIRKESETSALLVTYPESGTAALKQGQWFAHVQLMNSSKVLGKKTPFKVIGYLLK
jgi:hypothetical protein